MARLEGAIRFTGSLGDYVAFKLPGSNIIYLRRKGKVSKAKRKSASFAVVRKNNVEFGGRGVAASLVKQAVLKQSAITKYGFVSKLNALLKPLQEMDIVSPLGKRSVLFTKNPELLNDFNLIKTKPFDAVVRNPVRYSVSKSSLSASLHIPALLPDINFSASENGGVYKIVATLGVVPDLHYNGKKYAPRKGYSNIDRTVAAETDWRSIVNEAAAESLALAITNPPPDDDFVLLLSIGIRLGVMVTNTQIYSSKTQGAAKILNVV